MIFVIGVRSIMMIFYCIILVFVYQTVALRLPGLQDLLQIAEIFPSTVTHPPEEAPLTLALCNLKTVQPKCFKIIKKIFKISREKKVFI